MAALRNCPDCGVAPGTEHLIGRGEGDFGGCDVARCLATGSQRLACGGEYHSGSCGRDVWTGEWPGVAECREFGWYAKMVPGQGWVATTADDPTGMENLNRLFFDAQWSPELRRFVLPWTDQFSEPSAQ